MGRVRNVVLIECTLGLGKPKKGRDFRWEGVPCVCTRTMRLSPLAALRRDREQLFLVSIHDDDILPILQ
jgi:hypothetical protein